MKRFDAEIDRVFHVIKIYDFKDVPEGGSAIFVGYISIEKVAQLVKSEMNNAME